MTCWSRWARGWSGSRSSTASSCRRWWWPGAAPVLIFFLMASFDLVIGLIFVVFALLTLVTTPLFMLFTEESSRRRRTSYGAFGADFLDSIQGIATLKIFGRGRSQGEHLADRARHLYRTTMGVLAVNMVSVGVTTFGILGGTACALGWGALKVSAGELEVRSLIVILIMARRSSVPRGS